jgi:predicted nucleic acid-binding protein
MPCVLDASAAVTLLVDVQRRSAIRDVLGGDVVLAPAHVDAEVLSALRGLVRGAHLDSVTAARAVGLWIRAPVRRWSTVGLLAEAWRLRDAMTAYDALYVTLARVTNARLLTADRRLARAAASAVDVVLV